MIRSSWVAALVLLALVALPESQVHANATCMQSDNKCEPDKLCTFKAQLAEKVFLYQLYLRNSPKTRDEGKREGIRWDGTLYNEAVAEAKKSFPNAPDQAEKAGQIFQEKIRAYAGLKFKMPSCTGGAMHDASLLPKAGYSGAYTNQHCQVWFKFDGGESHPDGFGATDKTPCQEFYDRDYAHEMIHRESCLAARDSGQNLDAIDNMIEDEIAAYRHSVFLSKAYVRLLSIRCSRLPNPAELKARTKRIQDLLTPYLKKGK